MKYNMTGASLPMLNADRQDPIFHIDESFVLAEGEINGDKFEVILYTCGEVSIIENGEYVDVEDVIDTYNTDEKLFKALNAGILEQVMNNWYEPQVFYVDKEGNSTYLELTSDLVVYSFDEAIDTVKKMLDDSNFEKDLATAISEIKEKPVNFTVEKEYMTGETYRYEVASDGTKLGDKYNVDGEGIATKVVVGFLVQTFGSDGMIRDVHYYPVMSDTTKPPVQDDTGEWIFPNNEADVLETIKQHYPSYNFNNINW